MPGTDLIRVLDHGQRSGDLVREITLRSDGRPVAFSAGLVAALAKAFADAEADDRIGAVVLGHEGRAFCAGSDLGTLVDCGADRDRLSAFLAPMMALFRRIDRCPLPTVAAIEGAAVGGGFELALACDLRVMGGKAWIALPETGFGTLPGGGGLQRLTHYIGRGRTLDLVLTGDRLSAEDCVRLGLARTVEAGSARAQALALAARLAGGARQALALAKTIIRDVSETSADDLEDRALAAMLDTLTGAEGQEGLRAIAERRAPNFGAARGKPNAD